MALKRKKVIYDRSKLRGRIIEKFGSQSAFADAVNLSDRSVSRKLTGKEAITVQNIHDWSQPDVLDIPPDEYPIFYFVEKGEENGDTK